MVRAFIGTESFLIDPRGRIMRSMTNLLSGSGPGLLLGLFLVWLGVSGPGPALAQVPAEPSQSQEPGPDLAERPLHQPLRYPRSITIHNLPEKVTLCGELVPLHLPEVYEMLDREFHISVYDQAQVIMWLKRANRYFPEMEKALARAGLPEDLKYMAVAESALKIYAWSPAGAAGPWQFITATGRRYGLHRTRHVDDRLDVEASTKAALKYLKDLHARFGSWPLAMAAYNCGEKRVNKEMKEQGVTDYFLLNLPLETERYVFRILAAKIVLENPKAYGYDPGRIRLYPPLETETVTIKLKKPIHVRKLAEAAGTYFRRLKELNPSWRGYFLPAGLHWVRLPAQAAEGFRTRLASMASAALLPPDAPLPKRQETFRRYVIAKGDTLSQVARRLGVTTNHLMRINNLSSNLIKPGQVIYY